MVANIDPIGRLSVVSQGTLGSRGTWRGASAIAGYRRFRVALDGGGWYVEHEPSLSNDLLSPAASDVRYAGAGMQARLSGEGSNTAFLLRTAASAGRIENDVVQDAGRVSVATEARGRLSASLRGLNLSALGGLLVDVGSTDGSSWQRSIATATLAVGSARHSLRTDWLRGTTSKPVPAETGRDAELFVVGGSTNPLIDPIYLSHRVALPAVPAGFLTGSDIQFFRATLGGNLWEPYFVWLNDGDGFEGLQRIGGIERTFGISSLGFVKLPSIRARGGASYSFDEPFANRARAYLSLTFTP
jgi:hypothetical protein